MLSTQNNANKQLIRSYDSGDAGQTNDNGIGDNDDANSESDLHGKDCVTFKRCISAGVMAKTDTQPAIEKSAVDDNGYHPIRPSTIFTKPIGPNCDDIPDGFSRKCIPLTRLDSSKLNGINVGFHQIVYRNRRKLCWNREPKTILNGLSGEFRAGELTAIMGPSGAGKSTLLDILSGYVADFTSGTITINDRPRDLKLFRNQAAYIMQDDLLHSHITAWEAMYFAVNLKIGNQLKRSEKKLRIHEILEAIGIHQNRHTKIGELSGGQRKRLSIALELVDNPQFMAFDEPTTGLDSITSTQVISLLKYLAQGGRTIICTMHQPSALMFGMFDHLYALAEGQCIYSGATDQLVPFLTELDLICPKTYSPSDYLLEISTNDYGPHNPSLVQKIENGLNTTYRKSMNSMPIHSMEQAIAAGLITPIRSPDHAFYPMSQRAEPQIDINNPKKPKIIKLQLDTRECCRDKAMYATSFIRQWYLLMQRMILCLIRDRSLAPTRIFIHIAVASMVGTLFYNIGNDASMIANNFNYVFMSIMFTMFTAFSTMLVIFPLELPIVTREHFNRWYSIKAYYFALTLADFPLQLLCVICYVLITYFLTAQPLELFRICLFFITFFLVTLVSQGWGLVTGAVCGLKLGVIFGPFVIAPFMVFSGYFLRFSDAQTSMHWLFHISYLKYALEGASNAVLGFDRPKMPCNEIYCHYRLPKKFMEDRDMYQSDFGSIAIILTAICLSLRIVAFFIMSLRIKRR